MEAERIRIDKLDPDMKVPSDAYDRFRGLVRDGARRLAGRFGDEAVTLVLLVPDLLALFWAIARDPRITSRHKLLAGAVVGYLLTPFDLMPEAILGPLGIGDDVVLAFLALDLLLNRVPHHILMQHWRGKRDLIEAARLGTRLAARLIPKPVYDRVSQWLAANSRRTARQA